MKSIKKLFADSETQVVTVGLGFMIAVIVIINLY